MFSPISDDIAHGGIQLMELEATLVMISSTPLIRQMGNLISGKMACSVEKLAIKHRCLYLFFNFLKNIF